MPRDPRWTHYRQIAVMAQFNGPRSAHVAGQERVAIQQEQPRGPALASHVGASRGGEPDGAPPK